MTREEAISQLISLNEEDVNIYSDAVEYAIKALEQEPCEDCISRQAVVERIKREEKVLYTPTGMNYLIRAINDLPSVKPQAKTGRWIHTEECDEEWQYRCSKCDMPSRSNSHRYCSNCGSYMYGAKMESEG